MKKLFVVFILFSMLLTQQLSAKAVWTVMFYLTSAPDLEEEKIENILELCEVGSNSAIQVIVQIDWALSGSSIPSAKKAFPDRDYTGVSRYFIHQDQIGLLSHEGEANVGDANVLEKFLKYCVKTHPADNYMLVFGGHGSGFETYSDLELPLSVRNQITTAERAPFPEDALTDDDRSIAYDDKEADSISLKELKTVLNRFRGYAGKRLDFLVFESCLMLCLETVHQMKDVAQVTAGSEAGVLIGGVTYDSFVKPVKDKPSVSKLDYLNEITSGLVGGGSWSTTWTSMWNGAAAAAFVNDTKDVNSAVNGLVEAMFKVERSKLSFKKLTAFGKEERYVDLATICNSIISGNVGFYKQGNYEEVKSAAQGVLNALSGIRAAMWTAGNYNHCGIGGVSVWWPVEKERYNAYRQQHKDLDLTQDCRWHDFLEYFILGIRPE